MMCSYCTVNALLVEVENEFILPWLSIFCWFYRGDHLLNKNHNILANKKDHLLQTLQDIEFMKCWFQVMSHSCGFSLADLAYACY